MSEKTITIRISKELHKDIKKEVADQEISIKDYIVSLIKRDLYGDDYDGEDDEDNDDSYEDDDDPLTELFPNEEDPEERARLFQNYAERAAERFGR